MMPDAVPTAPVLLGATVLFIAVMLWRALFQPLWRMQPKLSHNIRELVQPDAARASSSMTTLASAAVVLTFTAIQAVGEPPVSARGFLFGCWIAFTGAVAAGVAATILLYVYRAQSAVTVSALKDFVDARNAGREKDVDKPTPQLRSVSRMQQLLTLLLYGQAVAFFAGVLFLLIFAISITGPSTRGSVPVDPVISSRGRSEPPTMLASSTRVPHAALPPQGESENMPPQIVPVAAFVGSHWLVGLAVALLPGVLVAGAIVSAYRRDRSCFFEGLWIGILERLFFSVGVAFNLPGIGVAMIAWIAAKMAAGWNRTQGDDEEAKRPREAALVGSLGSMLFAVLGGLICGQRIVW